MRTWHFVVLASIGLTLAGCRTDPAIAILERDNRLKEDEIHKLRWRIEDLEDALHGGAADSMSAAPRSAPAELGPLLTPADEPAPLGPVAPIGPRPSTRSAPGPGMKLPTIEMPGEALPEGQVPERLRIPGRPDVPKPLRDGRASTAPGAVRGSPAYGAQFREPGDRPLARLDSVQVAQITLNKSLTAQPGGDASPTDSLLVVVEPRDLRGDMILAPGNVSVMLFDPTVKGESGMVARWDFTAADTAGMLQRGQDGGIHIRVPWPANPPAHGQLRLLVRYTTRDGRKLQLERPITVPLARARSRDWSVVKESPLIEPRPSGSDAAPDLRSAEPMRTEPVRTATRPDEYQRSRPVWSPERPM